ncbi:MAG: flagellar protein export ATPase FliI [Alphaproteobacteria bacterium]|nr:flagellar protein export ATPase FliI [Alphaproteobacteria bacterium]
MRFESLLQEIEQIPDVHLFGTVVSIQGLVITVAFASKILTIGCQCSVEIQPGKRMPAEVIGFNENHVLVMPFGDIRVVHLASRVYFSHTQACAYPHVSWTGRVLNALAEPIDGGPPLLKGLEPARLHNTPPQSHCRSKVEERLDVGIRAMNTFLTCCEGQRMGIFAGSGVGKSMLMSMLARFTACDICVIGLIGERGREVKEFLEDSLGEEGLKKSIVVVSTSDEPTLMRRQAAYLTLSIAEYFRDQGLSVLCMMDSVTRFAMAQREIGLSSGEPPTTKGYTPSVFAELPKLLERAGPGTMTENGKTGTITGFFTVLVDGDDHNEPIADAVRGILDGHIVLDRSIAERGHYPAINILRSISRTVPGCHTPVEQKIVKEARQILATYENMADMIRLGAYRPGSNPEVDQAIKLYPDLMAFLAQNFNDQTSLEESFARLKNAL